MSPELTIALEKVITEEPLRLRAPMLRVPLPKVSLKRALLNVSEAEEPSEEDVSVPLPTETEPERLLLPPRVTMPLFTLKEPPERELLIEALVRM